MTAHWLPRCFRHCRHFSMATSLTVIYFSRKQYHAGHGTVQSTVTCRMTHFYFVDYTYDADFDWISILPRCLTCRQQSKVSKPELFVVMKFACWRILRKSFMKDLYEINSQETTKYFIRLSDQNIQFYREGIESTRCWIKRTYYASNSAWTMTVSNDVDVFPLMTYCDDCTY